MISKTYKNKGFTLIELVVVMSVIAMLAGLSMFALQGARETARDAKRTGDLEAIATALEMYKADCHQYPPNADISGGSALTSPASCGPNTYLEEVPQDPLGTNYRYNRPTSVTYTLCTHLEDSTDVVPNADCGGACDPAPCRHRITNP